MIDVENAIRLWIRTLNLPGLGTRSYFAVPDGTPVMPLVTVARLGGAPDRYVPTEDARLTNELWAKTKKEATDAQLLLVAAMQNVYGELVPGVMCHGINVDAVMWRPDPETKLARYVIDSTATVGPSA